jgi:cystathionine gamma-synthase
MASATAVSALCRPGDHIVAQDVMYSGLARGSNARRAVASRASIWSMLGDRRASARGAPRQTRTCGVETPANPPEVVDLAAAAAMRARGGALPAVDSTVATPVHTRPIEHGADLVMHAATKYFERSQTRPPARW